MLKFLSCNIVYQINLFNFKHSMRYLFSYNKQTTDPTNYHSNAEHGTWNAERGTLNVEHGTRNAQHGT